jgi:hypothetical protein
MTADQHEYLTAGADQYVSLDCVINAMEEYSPCLPIAFLRNPLERKRSKKCWSELGHIPALGHLDHL